MKNQKKLPYEGTLVRQIPREVCYFCKHYGCTDAIETQCWYERARKLTMAIRNMISKSNIK